MFEYPGGKKEENETLSDTLRRECQEELGIEITNLEDFILGPFEYKVKDFARIYLLIVRAWVGEIKPVMASEFKWVDLSWAVDHLPLMPIVYDSYQDVQAYLNDYA